MRILIFSPMTRFAMKHYLQCIVNVLGKDDYFVDSALILPSHAEVETTLKTFRIGGGGKLGVLLANINPWTFFVIAYAIARHKPDCIHVLNGENRLTTLWLFYLARVWSIRTIISLHDPEPHPCARLDKMTHRLGKFTTSVATDINIHDKAHVPTVRHYNKPAWVFPFPDIATLFPPETTCPREKMVLFFGRIEPYKGLPNFVELAVRMAGKALFVVAGSGNIDADSLRTIKTNPTIFEVHNRFIEDAEMISFFDRAMVVLLPYESATQSGMPAGAASRGAVPVGFGVGGLANQLPDVGGIAVRANDLDALEEAVNQVLDGTIKLRTTKCTSDLFSSGLIDMYKNRQHPTEASLVLPNA